MKNELKLMLFTHRLFFPNRERDAEKLRPRAESGDAEAQCDLAFAIFEWNPREALAWLERSAEQGYPRALSGLARCYYSGVSVRKNYRKAVEILKRLEKIEPLWANASLGGCELLGRGVPRNIESGVARTQAVYDATAKGGPESHREEAAYLHAVAAMNLAFSLWRDRNARRTQADRLFAYVREAAASGLPEAIATLGTAYYCGLGVEKDRKKGSQLWKEAADLGVSNASLAYGAKMVKRLRFVQGFSYLWRSGTWLGYFLASAYIYLLFAIPYLVLHISNAVVVSGPTHSAVSSEYEEKLVGKPLHFSGTLLDGTPCTLEDFRGKVLLVDFWATWCGPCRKTIPHLKKLHEKYHSQGLEILGVSCNQDPEYLRQFVGEEAIPWKQMLDSETNTGGVTLSDFCGVQYIPFLLILNRNGEVAVYDPDDVERVVADLLKEPH
ncbi:MAG: redoxin family protein [Planctomycetia bacterium]|nr:redoxin family protein [Planctomycetia bacterium]